MLSSPAFLIIDDYKSPMILVFLSHCECSNAVAFTSCCISSSLIESSVRFWRKEADNLFLGSGLHKWSIAIVSESMLIYLLSIYLPSFVIHPIINSSFSDSPWSLCWPSRRISFMLDLKKCLWSKGWSFAFGSRFCLSARAWPVWVKKKLKKAATLLMLYGLGSLGRFMGSSVDIYESGVSPYTEAHRHAKRRERCGQTCDIAHRRRVTCACH